MYARGCKPNAIAFSSLITTNAAAPSLIVEAFAAVTVPSLVKAGFKLLTLSNFTLVYSSSFDTITGSPFRCGTATGTISLSNFPACQALALRSYD